MVHLLYDLQFLLVLALEEVDEVLDLHFQLGRQAALAAGLHVALHNVREYF